MSYQKQEIKKGITLHMIKTENFKTNLIAVFLTTPLTRENVTKDSLLNLVLRRGSMNFPSQEEISKKMEEMYGATFDCGIEKTGDNHVMKFYLECINDEYLPKGENLLQDSLKLLFDIIMNPVLEDGKFKEEYVNGEKEKLRQIINGKIDNKAMYALNRCIETMYENEPYGLYKYGYEQDIDNITNRQLYDYYQTLIKQCKIDIFVSGEIKEEITKNIIDDENVTKLEPREPIYIKQSIKNKEVSSVKKKEESMDVAQGKLVIGLDIKQEEDNTKYVALMYNAILGGTANSKLFQNVREKASLAYTANSNYLKPKGNIFVRCGIEIDNLQKAMDIIEKQLEDMRKGDFSEEDITNAKNYIISTIRVIPDEQDTEISFYLGQELSDSSLDIPTYIEKINEVSKQDIVSIANTIVTDTIYFLKN